MLTPELEAQLIADLSGERGAAMQAAAEAWTEAEGIEFSVEGEGGEEDYDDAWNREAETQVRQLEKVHGRKFSEREKDEMYDFHGESDLAPDMENAYEKAIGRSSGRDFYRSSGKDDRQAVALEMFREAAASHEQDDEPLGGE